MPDDRIDILPVIRRYCAETDVSYCREPRDNLLAFARREFPDKNADLIADCLIAAGFGRTIETPHGEYDEQHWTVYGGYSYGD